MSDWNFSCHSIATTDGQMVEDSEGNGVPPLELFLVGSAARGMIFFSDLGFRTVCIVINLETVEPGRICSTTVFPCRDELVEK